MRDEFLPHDNVALLAGLGSVACASEVSGLISFSAGTTAKTSEVNDNFTAVKGAVDDDHAQLQALKDALAALQDIVEEQAAMIATLSDQLCGVRNSQIMALEGHLTVANDDYGRLTVTLERINLQLVNGLGATATTNGLGNLIIGYDEPRTTGDSVCSIGEHTNPGDCADNGGTWAASHESGSHYVVIGPQHNYSQYGGLLAGTSATSNGPFASVTGGSFNTVSGYRVCVSGGTDNKATGYLAGVSGGIRNTASGLDSSVTGGSNNTAGHSGSSMGGGQGVSTSGIFDWNSDP